ncbi:hypothetical protein B0J11DRAFT_595273 [Dendryphion nanum]|uniref:DUF924-domain-containing protein n=1 Tax=Dendryphion nanum TaxID=256645 RepID=A0A9P9D6X0_9PLEO|nr:hypothetical protein B0J11DRAFT_595273 [Dendryphion nanum]
MESSSLEKVVTHEFLDAVCHFWFSHINDSDHIIVPDIDDAMPWFSQSDAYDNSCINNFGAQLQYIKSAGASGTDIVSATKPETPLHWMSLIILLDQLPRNCFRGDHAGIAYNIFDGLALDVALQAIKLGIPQHPQVRFRHAYRFWFYLPLEHSESLKMQEVVREEHVKMFQDSRMLMDDESDSKDSDLANCQTVLRMRKVQLEEFKDKIHGICDGHEETLRRFGRYPHRNNALGRVSTADELAYLQK